MNFAISCVQYIGKTVCYVYRIGYRYQLLFNIGYRKTEKIDIGTPLVTDSSISSRSLANILISKIIFESLNIHQMNIHLNPSVRMYVFVYVCRQTCAIHNVHVQYSSEVMSYSIATFTLATRIFATLNSITLERLSIDKTLKSLLS